MNADIYERLHHNHVFAHLDRYMFQMVEKLLVFRQLEPNEYLFLEGEHGDTMAFVLHGELSIIKKSPQGSPIIIHRMHAGDSIGEMALLDDLTRSASVQATELSALVILSRQDFETILAEYPQTGIAMLRGIATMLSLNLRRTSENLSRNAG